VKKKVLYFTSIPSPFQLEFIDYVNSHSTNLDFIPVFMGELVAHRKTWGEVKSDNIVLKNTSTLGRLRAVIKLISGDDIHALIFTQYNSLYTMIAVIVSVRKKIPYYIGPIERMSKRNVCIDWVKKRYFQLVLSRARALFAIGNNAAKNYAEIYKGPIHNIPYTFDLVNLLESERKNNNKITFLYSGRLIPFRNPLMVLDCFAEVAKGNDSVDLIMSGVGELREQCDETIRMLGIEDKVTWHNDFVDWYDIHKNLYRRANVLLALQKYSAWGLIIQEAMAAGLGIIATRTMESANELIVDEYNGFIVPLEKDLIVLKMNKYVDDRDLLKLHGDRSKQIVKVVDLEHVGDRFLECFGRESAHNF